MDGQTDGRTDGRTDGQADRRTDWRTIQTLDAPGGSFRPGTEKCHPGEELNKS